MIKHKLEYSATDKSKVSDKKRRKRRNRIHSRKERNEIHPDVLEMKF